MDEDRIIPDHPKLRSPDAHDLYRSHKKKKPWRMN
ncbi:hypothetical protein SY94_5011 (plasmid) [Agrobacterium tumefaciens]|nr:hypothetical protein SY94_5011 [Agrobacterium tumefaciens]